MAFGGRDYFVAAFAVVFHLAVTAAIFHAAWTSVPSVNAPSVNTPNVKAPSVNVDEQVGLTILRTIPTETTFLAGELPVQPNTVRPNTVQSDPVRLISVRTITI